MDSITGEIKDFESWDKALKARYDVPLTKSEAKDLKKIKPKSRIPFATMTKNQRKAFRKKIRQRRI